MNTNGHYLVRYTSGQQGPKSRIGLIKCRYCMFSNSPIAMRPIVATAVGRRRSVLGGYSRARAEMVKHLHSQHPTLLEYGPIKPTYNPRTGDFD